MQSDPLYVIVKALREKRSQGWLDYVGYTRDKTVKKDTIDTVEKAVQELQLQVDLMRDAK